MEFFIYSRAGVTPSKTPAAQPSQARSMLKDSQHDHEKILKSGEYIKANGRDLYLYMQTDGNLCFYPNTERSSHTCIWASGTHGKGRAPHYLVMQDDGNLVIYDADNRPTWSTNTHGKGRGCNFHCQEDGNLVIYDSQRRPIWASDTRA